MKLITAKVTKIAGSFPRFFNGKTMSRREVENERWLSKIISEKKRYKVKTFITAQAYFKDRQRLRELFGKVIKSQKDALWFYDACINSYSSEILRYKIISRLSECLVRYDNPIKNGLSLNQRVIFCKPFDPRAPPYDIREVYIIKIISFTIIYDLRYTTLLNFNFVRNEYWNHLIHRTLKNKEAEEVDEIFKYLFWVLLHKFTDYKFTRQKLYVRLRDLRLGIRCELSILLK